MGALLTFIASAFASLVGQTVVRFAAWKLVIWTIVVVVLPIVLNNFIHSLLSDAISLVNSYSGSSSSMVVQLSGLAGWFATYLRIPEGFSILISAIVFRITIKLIPFIRL
jgi:hypothetical protein